MHFIKYVEGSVDLGEAFLKVFAHLLSDVFTKTGLPCPFMPLIQLCKGETPFILKKNGEKVTFTDLSRYMYANGYDFRHFLTMGTETLFIELVLHVYFKLAYFEQDIVFLLSFVFHKYVNRSNQLKVSEIY